MGTDKGRKPSTQQLGGGWTVTSACFPKQGMAQLGSLLFPLGQTREWYRMVLNWSRNWWPCLAVGSWVTSSYLNAVKWQLIFIFHDWIVSFAKMVKGIYRGLFSSKAGSRCFYFKYFSIWLLFLWYTSRVLWLANEGFKWHSTDVAILQVGVAVRVHWGHPATTPTGATAQYNSCWVPSAYPYISPSRRTLPWGPKARNEPRSE